MIYIIMSFVWINFYLTFRFSVGGALALELLTQKPSYNTLQIFQGIGEGYYKDDSYECQNHVNERKKE